MAKKKKEEIEESVFLPKLKHYIRYGEGDDISHTFEKLQEPKQLPYYDGLHSLIHPKASRAAHFVFTDETVLPGYYDTNVLNTLDLTTGKKKMIISLSGSIYHFMVEDLGSILQVLEDGYRDIELIADISGIAGLLNRNDLDMFLFFLQTLNDKGIKHKIVNLKHFDVIYIDHFFVLTTSYAAYNSLELIYNHFDDYVVDKTIEPYRKIYLSRKKVDESEFEHFTDSDGIFSSVYRKRIDDEEKLEKLMLKHGFETVYPEDFDNFEEQINFFRSVKTIASLTSSGLANALLMKPGGTVVEITTPLVVAPLSGFGELGYINREIHNYYKTIAMLKRHLYISIPNPYVKIRELDEFFDSIPYASKILKGL